MPFSDPIRDRRIQPESLAFRDGKTARGGASATYQSVVRAEAVAANVDVAPINREIRRVVQDANGLPIDAEQRAKHYAATFSDVTEWYIASDITLMLGAVDVIPFNGEIYRCMGAAYRGGSVDEWYHKVGKDDAGIWWYYTHIILSLPALANATAVKISMWKNNAMIRVIDQMDAEMGGETPFRDVVLRGGLHVNLEVGDRFDVRIEIKIPGVPGPQLFGWPTSVGGYVTGHRVRCNQTSIGAPDDMNSFNFS